jgi:hypothetical protein
MSHLSLSLARSLSLSLSLSLARSLSIPCLFSRFVKNIYHSLSSSSLLLLLPPHAHTNSNNLNNNFTMHRSPIQCATEFVIQAILAFGQTLLAASVSLVQQDLRGSTILDDQARGTVLPMPSLPCIAQYQQHSFVIQEPAHTHTHTHTHT